MLIYTYRELSKLPNRFRVFIQSGTHTLVPIWYIFGLHVHLFQTRILF